MSRFLERGLAALVVVPGLVALAACGSGYGSSPTQSTMPAGTKATADVTITIRGMSGNQSFAPNPGMVTAGQTVSWRNADTLPHTATGTGFDTGTIQAGASSTPLRFSNAGSFDYHCAIHPSMVGSLSVTAAAPGGY